LRGRVLEELRGAFDDLFVELPGQALVAVLHGIIGAIAIVLAKIAKIHRALGLSRDGR
jgi:hypothetical protein